ncbi:efflux RND transporter permease subunit [Pseudohongiella spirulinae]|uniref:Cobalt-zinc-cadmium resistance protein (CzcA)-like n=1 Tax=Pseudohongiella spirulinae TaxID=1249552 RepID=A0A0S2KHA7_9GAMM|nr:efflux RND transporter permease subunit [Pseudohongiella spirulinae]ALO47502.1 Cobalt-zinc-cadmium resistance protein (CzcA)-like [Pseudohongiella spirulinae]
MKPIIAWFVKNPVAANLLMMFFIVAGITAFMNTRQEEFPSIETGTIQINVPYRGASPDEAEQAICIVLEEALRNIENVERITSTAREGACAATLQMTSEADINRSLNEVKSAVDGIVNFPADIERPIVASFSVVGTVMSLALSADTDEETLKRLADEVRLDLLDLPEVSRVEVSYVRPREISIEVPELLLRQYGLTLNEVATAIDRNAMDMPAGTLRTPGGDVLLRSKGRMRSGEEYEDIIIRTNTDGSRLRLGDIATVRDDFEEGYLRARVDGRRAVTIDVFRVGDEDIIASADATRAYAERKARTLPEGVQLEVLTDDARALRERVSTVSSNAYSGFLLVLAVLALFLRFKLAIWVAAGIPIAIFGALAIFPYFDITISSITIMAFILVLGIIVDDAIVVGERIFVYEQTGIDREEAAIKGTYEVSVPVIFGVATTIAAFLPLLLLDGPMGGFFNVIGGVVILCLLASVVESQLILPGHLAHRKTTGYLFEGSRFVNTWHHFQGRLASGLEYFASHVYQPALRKCLHHRYSTWAAATAVIIITVGLLASGRVVFQFFPAVEGDRIYASLQMPEGVAVDLTEQALAKIEGAAQQLRVELDQELAERIAAGTANGQVTTVVDKTLTTLGARINRGGPPTGRGNAGGSHIAEVVLILNSYKDRGEISANEIRDRWREKVGVIPDALELSFVSDSFSAGEALSFRMEGRSEQNLRLATAELREALARYPGVLDITDSFREGKQEVQISLLDAGIQLGFTLEEVSRQVRQAFFGVEAQRIQRDTDEIRVMVRYPQDERQSLGNLENLMLRTPAGGEVPLASVADLQLGNAYSTINRQNGRRVITVNADVNRAVSAPEEVTREIVAQFRDSWSAQYDIDLVLSGEGEQRARSLGELFSSYPLALLIMFALLAIPLKSYAQPLIIMSVIPFGAIGAIVGHYIMGQELVFFSLIGIVALGGVVVNASLVLVVYINSEVKAGHSLVEAVSSAGVARFRPVFLTSVTTFIGLVPLMFTPSPATFFIIPMAVSLAFGVLFATVITLFLVPSLYMILYDFSQHRLLAEEHREDPALST